MIVWAVETMIAVSALMLIVLTLRWPVTALFGARWAYALWLLPALRLVLPPLPFDLPTLFPDAAFIPAAEGMAAPLPPTGGPGQWVPQILALWAGGAAIFLFKQWLSYRGLLRRLGACRPANPPRFGGIAVVESEAAEGPMAIGIFERRIVVPPLFDYRYTAAEQRLALEHELLHHRRGDLWWNLVALLVLALNWFNPIAYAAFRAYRMDQELSCDAAIAAQAPQSRRGYASALMKSASRPGLVAACPLGPADQLNRRLKMIDRHRTGRARGIGGAAVVGALLTGGLAGTATAAEEPSAIHDMAAEPACPEAAAMTAAAVNGKMVAALEKARSELGTHDEMTGELRAEAIAMLEREIDRLRHKLH